MLMLFPALTWLGIGVDYLIAGVLIAGGGYVAFVLGANPINPLTRLFHYIGILLIVVGVLIGAMTYGKSRGAADCEAAWKAKNYEARIARLQQESAAKDVAAKAKEQAAQQLAEQKQDADKRLADYAAWAVKLQGDLKSCRAASRDDDRRLCDIVGAAAAGCAHP